MLVNKTRPRPALWISIFLLLGFAIGALTAAVGDKPNGLLRGDHAVTQMLSCMQTKNVFEVPSFAFNDTTGLWETMAEVETNVISLTGVSRFDGKGHWQLLGGERSPSLKGMRVPGRRP